MPKPTHHIRRQVIEIRAGDAALAQQLADRTAAAAPRLAARLAQRFDAIEDGRRRRIDRLVLALPPCDPDRFEADLLAHLDRALDAALPAQLAHAEPIDPHDDAADLITGFVRSGLLPWWAEGKRDAFVIAAQALIDAEDDACVAALRPLLRDEDAALRLAGTLPAQLLPGFVARFSGLPAETIERLAFALVAEQRDVPPLLAAAQAWRVLLIAAVQTFPTPDGFEAEARRRLATADSPTPEPARVAPAIPPPASSLPAHAPGVERSPGIGAPAAPPRMHGAESEDRNLHPEQDGAAAEAGGPDARVGDRPNESRSITSDARQGTDPADPSARQDGSNVARAAAHPQPTPPILAPGARDDRRPSPAPPQAAQPQMPDDAAPATGAIALHGAGLAAVEHDTIAIEAAGTVLLAPFLPGHFAALGLLDPARRFVSEAARHRAVLLIDHLATADRSPPEARLALAKLMAGMPIAAVLPPALPLDDIEVAAAETLLAGILAELPMLGRLRIAGFRSAWLDRPGLLCIAQGTWLLRVEQRSWDMLLDRLPWTIDWLDLPWQQDGIRVEW